MMMVEEGIPVQPNKCNHKEIKRTLTVPISFVKNHPDIIRRMLSSGKGLILVINDDGSYGIDEDHGSDGPGVSGVRVFENLEDFELKLKDYHRLNLWGGWKNVYDYGDDGFSKS